MYLVIIFLLIQVSTRGIFLSLNFLFSLSIMKLLLHGINYQSLQLTSMASCDSNSPTLPHSSSTLSSATQYDFSTMVKAFNFIPTKLDSDNYLYEKAHILATIRAFDLLSFINKLSPLPKYLSSNQEEPIVNPEYLS